MQKETDFKGQLHSKNKLSSNERARKMQKNEPSLTSMRQMVLEISHSKSQEFEQDGSRHFGGFRPHFHINIRSQTQSCKKTIK